MCAQKSEFSSDDEFEPSHWSNNLSNVCGTIKQNGVEGIDDDTLYITLRELKVNVGPIVDSTRKLYRNLLLQHLKDVCNNTKSHQNGNFEEEFSVSAEEQESEEEVEVRKEDIEVIEEYFEEEEEVDEHEIGGDYIVPDVEEKLREPIVKQRLPYQSTSRMSLPVPLVRPTVNVRPAQKTRVHTIQPESHFLRNAFIGGLAFVVISLVILYNLQTTWR